MRNEGIKGVKLGFIAHSIKMANYIRKRGLLFLWKLEIRSSVSIQQEIKLISAKFDNYIVQIILFIIAEKIIFRTILIR